MITCMAILAATVMYLTIYYVQEKALMDYRIWDIHTVTVADFSCQISISKEVWASWTKQCKEQKKPVNDGFKKLIKDQMVK